MLQRIKSIFKREPVTRDSKGIPYPSAYLRFLVAGTDDLAWFIEGGELGAKSVRDLLQKNGYAAADFGSILDFGCGSGRVIRHWQDLPNTAVYGCDYNYKLINWCRQNLPFASFETNQLAPPLPYHENQFDLVYALSVFTHMPEELQQEWLREMARIIKPGGFLIITTHGKYYLNQMSDQEQAQFARSELVIRKSRKAGSNDCAAFHPRGYLQNKMVSAFELVDFVAEGATGNPKQDISLLRKLS